MYKTLKKTFFLFAWSLFVIASVRAQGTDSVRAAQTDTVYEDKAPPVSVDNYDPYNPTASGTDHGFDNLETGHPEQVQIRSVPDSFVQRLQDDPHFGYIKTGLKENEAKPADPSKTQHSKKTTINWATVITYLAIAIFIAILIWYLINNNFIFLKRKSTSVQTNHYQEAHKDIFSIDYATAIKEAVAQKDYRLAIRLQYLELLKTLAERQLISFMPDKTNFEYMLQMRNSPFYDDLSSVTRNYEYSWYGLFDITGPLYQQINNAFQRFKQKLK